MKTVLKSLFKIQSIKLFTRLYRNPANIMDKPIETTIRKKLEAEFKPTHLEVINESFMHNVPKGAETHFKVVVISDMFVDKPLIQRHRLVNDILKEELSSSVHALSIQAKTPEQWETSDKIIPKSPPCQGGMGR